jgi:hypothetical protein
MILKQISSNDSNDSSMEKTTKFSKKMNAKNMKKLSKTSTFQELIINQKYSLIGIGVVLLSILFGKSPTPQTHNSMLDGLVKNSCANGLCMEDLFQANGGETLQSGRKLEQGWKLFEIPRSMQIWTLDALRDPFVKNNLFGAKHLKTNNPLSPDAFLAAHISVLRSKKQDIEQKNDMSANPNQQMYLDILPTYDDYKKFHPVNFDLRELTSKHGPNSYLYFLVSRQKTEIESEYKSFTKLSSEFKDLVTYNDYVASRLNVQTKALNVALDGNDATKEELELYRKHLGVDIEIYCSAIVPLIDSIDGNHAKQNVQHKYVPETKKFFLYASKDIPSGTQLYGSYGDRDE